MPITINGTGSITGLSAGGLPDLSVATADIAAGAVTQAKRSEDLTLATAQNSTSGSNIDFTAIPAWVTRITVMFNGVSTSATSAVQVQLGTSGGFETTGYVGGATAAAAASAGFTSFTSGFVLSFGADSAATTRHGAIVISNLSGNIWVCQGTLSSADLVRSTTASYSKSLGGVLTQLRVTTTGADTFDAGSINILYE